MATEAGLAEGENPQAGGAGAATDDLRLRLRGREEQERAFRTEARRLARELAIARRLLRFSGENPAPARPRVPPPAAPAAGAARTPRCRAVLLTEPVIYHLDSCERRGGHTAICGWAFRPAPGWDARATTVTLLFRDGASVYQAPAVRMPRPDVAAHYAAQGTTVSGGALGLDGAGFACEIVHDSLPVGADLALTLRLECAGLACEQPTGDRPAALIRPGSMHASPLPAPPLPIRVAVDLSNLRPGGENGGIKPFLFETLLWLGRQRRTPLRFLYLTCAGTHADVREELARADDELICVRDDGGPLPRGDERAPRERLAIPPPMDLLRRLGARVLYCPFGPVDFALPGIGTISTIVDVLHRDFPWSLGAHHNAERERVFQEIVAVADALQCNSEHVVSRMHAHFGVPAERMFTVYNAVHGRFAALPEPHGGHPATPPPTAPFFFYPANAWKHKNHEVLLLAYGLYRAGAMAAGVVPWTLVLTGHEDERWAQMRALAQTLGLLGEDAVRFVGYMPAQEFRRLWETAGALVFPSLHEGFGIPLLEAMEHDVPVLCSRDGSLPEVGADACLFVDARRPEALADAMTQLSTDAALRQRLVEAGRRRLADFSQDHEAGRLLEVIAALSQTTPPYHPCSRGIFPDGWTESATMLALPAAPVSGTLTLRFNPMPVPRRLRLRTDSAALGGFDLPPDRLDHEIRVTFRPSGGALWMEIPDAANLNPGDARVHGVRLASVDLRLADGRDYPLFAAR